MVRGGPGAGLPGVRRPGRRPAGGQGARPLAPRAVPAGPGVRHPRVRVDGRGDPGRPAGVRGPAREGRRGARGGVEGRPDPPGSCRRRDAGGRPAGGLRGVGILVPAGSVGGRGQRGRVPGEGPLPVAPAGRAHGGGSAVRGPTGGHKEPPRPAAAPGGAAVTRLQGEPRPARTPASTRPTGRWSSGCSPTTWRPPGQPVGATGFSVVRVAESAVRGGPEGSRPAGRQAVRAAHGPEAVRFDPGVLPPERCGGTPVDQGKRKPTDGRPSVGFRVHAHVSDRRRRLAGLAVQLVPQADHETDGRRSLPGS